MYEAIASQPYPVVPPEVAAAIHTHKVMSGVAVELTATDNGETAKRIMAL
jgi:hypothetical protein